MNTAIVWFRADLRVADNPALAAAARRGRVLPLYIHAPAEEAAWPPGGATCWWLHHSLLALDESLRRLGAALIVRSGRALPVLRELIRESGADAVYWSRRYEPAAIERDAEVKSALRAEGVSCESYCAALLHEPWDVRTGEGRPYRVFTPFYKACLARGEPAAPELAPTRLRPAPAADPATDGSAAALGTSAVQIAPTARIATAAPDTIAALQLLPRIDWAGGLRESWTPGERGAMAALAQFTNRGAVARYPMERDRPDLDSVSRLSPFLHFGEISPRTAWHTVTGLRDSADSTLRQACDAFLRQLVWREFAHHLLFHYPHTPEAPLREEFAQFPWQSNAAALRAWQRGRTGFPLVDAGMRQLWHTGWMHNRVRMVAASFLVKDLRIHWLEGARWFWDTLVDADLANNTLGWQWTAGCGADAAPYFRIFNPITQGAKFDPDGAYVRRWVPELRDRPLRDLHEPCETGWPPSERLLNGESVSRYPAAIVDHAVERDAALAAYAQMRRGT
ncbi:MAG: deoxyribodipyrimidine photo-lyase [Phycisphaerales bacterium]|nr:deoxyribodipyrimidine photo-lyase [Phycisphaerales bacterium]